MHVRTYVHVCVCMYVCVCVCVCFLCASMLQCSPMIKEFNYGYSLLPVLSSTKSLFIVTLCFIIYNTGYNTGFYSSLFFAVPGPIQVFINGLWYLKWQSIRGSECGIPIRPSHTSLDLDQEVQTGLSFCQSQWMRWGGQCCFWQSKYSDIGLILAIMSL